MPGEKATSRRLFLTMMSSSLLGLMGLPALSAENQSEQEKQAILLHILEIIDQVGIIIPGKGFKSIKLGDPVEKLIQLWGQPKIINRNGTLSYQLSTKTVIHFLIKKNRIGSIAMVGKPGSLARINNGVRFGMTQEQVLAQFSTTAPPPDKHKPDLIRYKALGIELGFSSNQLTEIAIFRPKN
jgi:hypothetical protein